MTVSPSVTATFTLTEEERALLPSDDDVEFYAEHGWYLTKKLFTDDEVDELVAASERYYAGERDRRCRVRPPKLALLGSVQWRRAAAQRLRPLRARRPSAEILRKPLIGAVAARLARADEIRVFQSDADLQAADRRTSRPTSCPGTSTSTTGRRPPRSRMLTAFIPFHDCDEEMGTITMVDGSHRWKEIGTRRHDDPALRRAGPQRPGADAGARTPRTTTPRSRKVPMVIPKGHMSFHHCRTYHGSGPNRSARPRRADLVPPAGRRERLPRRSC